MDDETPPAWELPREQTGRLTSAMLKEIHAKLCDSAIPNADGEFSFIVFFTFWERIVYWFNPRYALKLYADREIRNWYKKHRLSPDDPAPSAHDEKN